MQLGTALSHRHVTTLIAVAGLVLMAAQADTAEARERKTTVTGANGKTATRSVNRQQGDVSSSTAFGNGKTSSRAVEREPGSTQATMTGPNGGTATRSTTRTDTGSTTTLSGPQGKSGTVDVTRQP